MVIPSIASDRKLGDLTHRLAEGRGVVHVSGLWGSSARLVTAHAAAASHTILYLTAHLDQADAAREDLELFLGRPCDLFPPWETLPGEGASSGEIEAERLRVCADLDRVKHSHHSGGTSRVIVAPIQALMQPVPTPEALASNTLRLATCANAVDATTRRDALESAAPCPQTPQDLLEWVIDHGFERLDLVESPGDVAQRGDIVDLFAPGSTSPWRIQFLDDRIESIRRLEVETQRSMESLESVAVAAMGSARWIGTERATDFSAYLADGTLVVLDEPTEVQTMGATIHARLGGVDADAVFNVTDVLSKLSQHPQLHLSSFGAAATTDELTLDMGVTSVSRFEGDAAHVVSELAAAARDHTVHVFCDTEGESQRLVEMLGEISPQAAAAVRVAVGGLRRGFDWTATRTLVVPHHEIFHRQRQRRRIRKLSVGRPIDSWLDLRPGENVVHVVHGIAVYRGLKKMHKGDSQQQEEFLSLEFAGKALVYVPCSQIDLVQKYIGAAGRRPELSKIGGKRWAKTKQQAADAVSELAESMLRVHAIRERSRGVSYPDDTEWQREFEAAFPFNETEDQLIVAREIREDLRRPRPMDRLICGDVGYGKTELAMRAAFKVVEYGRQVAVLVPTTVLAEQHYRSFRDRVAEYPFTVGCLSRFRSAPEMRKIVEGMKKGRIDIVIGTHRLLSKDVSFANLGLVVIDEEQRFGVEHKERLKAMRETVDVLTMTATPIPRTLHMSLMGLREISSLQTPPVDRRSIATQVGPFNRELIRNAILREMNRDGQVYFVHNFVQSIAAMADTVRSIVPEARVVYAHGQMKDNELQRVMYGFSQQKADVLVSTTIIESGIDISSVNTIFINRAERYGLADLHQLRGRVGRSDHRAYCYLLLSPKHPPTGKAAKRLKTIEEFSELGAGFRIAMRDLEIRGAGDLLGREQSGHIAAVGYEMYCRLLEQTVRRLKNEPDPTPPPVQVDLDVAAHIPRHYISADRSRIEVYRRIAVCRTEGDLDQLEKDLVDAFGPIPDEVCQLLEVAQLRVLARCFGIRSISLRPPDVVFLIDRASDVETVFADAPGTVRMPDDKTVHLRPPSSYLDPGTLRAVLRKMFRDAMSRMEAKV